MKDLDRFTKVIWSVFIFLSVMLILSEIELFGSLLLLIIVIAASYSWTSPL